MSMEYQSRFVRLKCQKCFQSLKISSNIAADFVFGWPPSPPPFPSPLLPQNPPRFDLNSSSFFSAACG